MSSSDLPTCSKFVKSKSVNNKIIDYYLKYGKDRDIEKFMRFNCSSGSSCGGGPCPSKSSSGSDDNMLVSDELILAFNPCEMKIEVVSEADKENSTREANKNITRARTPTITTETIINVSDSATKIDRKLEWDSLGDVGYKKSKSTGNLTSLERSVLKELFSESPLVPNIPHQRSDEIMPSSSNSLSAESRREKWRQTLEILGKKYSSHSASINTQEFIDLPQSTPKVVPNIDKSCQTTFEKDKHLQKSKTSHSCQTTFEKGKPLEKTKTNHSCQTSFDGSKHHDTPTQLKSQETQANLSSRAESFATQSSFEYHAGERRSSQPSTKSSSSSTRRSILSEKNAKSLSTSESAKENLMTRRSNRPKTEVDLGIKLLCSLIDAKNLTGMQKKNLAKKIFEKITKQQSTGHDAGTGNDASMSSSSVSSAFSVRSLIECSPLCEDPKEIATQVSENKIVIEQMPEETRTEEPKVDEHSSPSLEEPITMREWLHPLTRSEKDYEKKMKKKSQAISSAHVSERSKQLSWIDMEINRLEGLKHLILQDYPSKSRSSSSSSTLKSSKRKSEIIYEETAEDVVNEEDHYRRSIQRTSQTVVIYDEPTADKQQQKHQEKEKVKNKAIGEDDSASSSSSLKKNHRSKLETPSSSPSTESESVGAFADQLQKQFMENYTKKKHTMSTEHYSEPRICGKPIFARNPSYTSVASSAFCMSSEMSIPIVESTSTSTTTHQYESNGCESIEGVAIQTSYSVIKSDPIFGPRCRCICTCGKECKCSCPRPTRRVSGKAFHQTVQVKPKALAYIIRFSETSDDQGNKLTEDGVSLQKRLEMRKPDFCSKANERREILKKLHDLRQEREEKIREIADCSSESSISRKLDELPPPPIKQVRICPSREMKGMTKKRYCKLPEVVAKQEREKLERRKKTTRVITNIFNKKLQRMVHKGKLSLENSRTVI